MPAIHAAAKIFMPIDVSVRTGSERGPRGSAGSGALSAFGAFASFNVIATMTPTTRPATAPTNDHVDCSTTPSAVVASNCRTRVSAVIPAMKPTNTGDPGPNDLRRIRGKRRHAPNSPITSTIGTVTATRITRVPLRSPKPSASPRAPKCVAMGSGNRLRTDSAHPTTAANPASGATTKPSSAATSHRPFGAPPRPVVKRSMPPTMPEAARLAAHQRRFGPDLRLVAYCPG